MSVRLAKILVRHILCRAVVSAVRVKFATGLSAFSDLMV